MTRLYIILAIYLLFPIIIVSAFHKWKIAQKIGTVILAYAVGIILALTAQFRLPNLKKSKRLAQFKIG